MKRIFVTSQNYHVGTVCPRIQDHLWLDGNRPIRSDFTLQLLCYSPVRCDFTFQWLRRWRFCINRFLHDVRFSFCLLIQPFRFTHNLKDTGMLTNAMLRHIKFVDRVLDDDVDCILDVLRVICVLKTDLDHPKNWSRSNFPLKNMSPGKMFMYVGPLYFSETLFYIQTFAKQTALFAFQFSSRPTTKLCTSWLYQWGSSVPAWRPVCRCVVSVCSTEPPSGASPAPSVSVALLTVTCNLYTGYIHSWVTPQCNYIFLSTNLILSGIWASIQACGFGAPNDDGTFQGYFWYNPQS